jgi:carbon-monoxide dehydrogenase large subunit
VGDRVALVVAETVDQAKAAAALIEVDYDELPPVVDTATATQASANVHDDAPDNQCYLWHRRRRRHRRRDQGAAHVTKLSFRNNRLIPNAMEPRAANASYNAAPTSTRCTWPTRTRTSSGC